MQTSLLLEDVSHDSLAHFLLDVFINLAREDMLALPLKGKRVYLARKNEPGPKQL